MKQFLLALLIVFLAATAQAQVVVHWDDVGAEESYIVMMKEYPDGYSYANQAPPDLVKDMTGVVGTELAANTLEWTVPDSLTIGQRYVFYIQAIADNSVIAAHYHCWTMPDVEITESPEDGTPSIEININLQVQ